MPLLQPFLDLEIRDQVARYAAGEISLAQLREWLVPVTWDVEGSNNPDAIDLAYQVEPYLAEFSRGHRTEEELFGLLRPLAEI